MIYLDNAATTLKKPESVIDAVVSALRTMGNSSRGTHESSLATSRTVFETRMKIAEFFGARGPENVAFTMNSTEALNIAIRGLVREGDHVITTEMEHNSVLRPLYHLLKDKVISLSILKADKNGVIDPADISGLIRPNTRMLVTTHSSNLTGNMVDIAEVAEINPDTYSPKDKWAFVNYLDTSSITNGVMSDIQLINPDTEKLPSRARRIVKANDIVYSTVRPNQLHFGIISNPLDNMLASTGFAVIRSKYDYISSPYIYHFLTSPDFIEKMQQLAEQSTSTFPSVKPSDIGTCLIPCADEAEMLDITDKINGMYALISANHQENKRLAALRDTLLPKLMNGEIDVSAVRI